MIKKNLLKLIALISNKRVVVLESPEGASYYFLANITPISNRPAIKFGYYFVILAPEGTAFVPLRGTFLWKYV